MRSGQALDGKGVHLFTGQTVLIRSFLRESSHRCAGVGVLQPVAEQSVVADVAVGDVDSGVGGRIAEVHRAGDAVVEVGCPADGLLVGGLPEDEEVVGRLALEDREGRTGG